MVNEAMNKRIAAENAVKKKNQLELEKNIKVAINQKTE
jgi:hypothetical protein